MNEEKRRGRPPKSHLHEDHHFRTSDEVAAAGAPPAAAEFDQTDASPVEVIPDSTSAEPIVEDVVAIEAPAIEFKESPIEEKIHQLVDSVALNGWKPIDTEIISQIPPRNGMPVRLSETPEGEGIMVIWKKTRKFANTTHRWQEGGKWIDFHSGMDITFQPKYWRERF